MDDFRLRVFITAAKTLNFTKCAEQLFISQPAVSKHIGELESRYKVQLFERSGSRLALTEAGRVMLEHAERIADGYRRLQYQTVGFEFVVQQHGVTDFGFGTGFPPPLVRISGFRRVFS